MRRGPAHRGMVQETLLALLVLAVAFLNFGHSNVAFAAGGRLVITTSSYCGNPLVPADGDHAPCHACRMGHAADLPPPPSVVEPVRFVATAVVYDAPQGAFFPVAPFGVAQPRAPPLA